MTVSSVSPREPMRWRAVLVLPLLVLASAALYSLLATVLAGALFPEQANGSLRSHDGRVVGSVLVAQPFAAAGYFQPRPSGAKYDPMSAAGSNQARSNPDLRKRLDATRQAVAAREGIDPAQVPDDLITQSGSGMDPDISVEAAHIQVARVAAARGLPPQTVAALVAAQTQPRQFGVLGEPRVNVLALNLALDAGNGEAGIGNGREQKR
ncbi:Potassium-transporting ATPase KdpC subunit [Xanthomonas sacchari]|uniref:potassium-transporting ATPase subunit KdpC n=1 Tax=Xanthomonas sacchari TaxID=56458 RepID=UPI002A325668|nr:Potassium-transporting ATPase KdpC subunit [Xanthomonas sacchari]MCW0446332.1 Potassium-transporting ATPase KdpC subunit [Xanthomonas sacchari]